MTMKNLTITIPDLKKGDIVLYYEARFEILEDARNCCRTEAEEKEALEFQPFGAKAKFISYVDGSGKKGDWLLEGFDWFQGNSFAKAVIEAPEAPRDLIQEMKQRIQEDTQEHITALVDRINQYEFCTLNPDTCSMAALDRAESKEIAARNAVILLADLFNCETPFKKF